MDQPSLGSISIPFNVTQISELSGSTESCPVSARNLQFCIGVKRYVEGKCEYLGAYVRCISDSEKEWTCEVRVQFSLKSFKGKDLSKSLEPCFYQKSCERKLLESVKLSSWSEMKSKKMGYMKNDSITLEAIIEVDLPHGPLVFWDSKEETGYSGIKKQRNLEYDSDFTNPVVQSLFLINKFRRAVLSAHEEKISEDSVCLSTSGTEEKTALALQSIFHEMSYSYHAASAKSLNILGSLLSTKEDSYHFLNVLLKSVRTKLNGVEGSDLVAELFEGKLKSVSDCVYTCKFKNKNKNENFYSFELDLEYYDEVDSLEKAFERYLGLLQYYHDESMQEDTYDIDSDGSEYGSYECKESKCKADCPNSYKDGIIFEWLPPVLHISITDFEISEKLSFPKEINLAKYVRENSTHESHDHQYTIFAFYCGHGDENILYANPKLNGKWYKFIDEVVYRVSEEEAMMVNFKSGTKVVNMLTYIRKSDVEDIL